MENQIKSHKDYDKVCLASLDSTECSDAGLLSFTNLFSEDEKSDEKISDSEL